MIEALTTDQWTALWSGVAAIATAVATGAAILAGIYAVKAYRKERDSLEHVKAEARERAEQTRRAQAELVAGWMPDRDRVRVHNASNLPVFSVRGWLHPRDAGQIRSGWITVLPPLAAESYAGWYVGGGALMAVRDWVAARSDAGLPIPAMLVELTFHDSAGQWWRRTREGDLLKITAAERMRSEFGSGDDADDDSRYFAFGTDYDEESQ